MNINISTDNDAFKPNPGQELARILRGIAKQLEEQGCPDHTYSMPIFDINGNTVGSMGMDIFDELKKVPKNK